MSIYYESDSFNTSLNTNHYLADNPINTSQISTIEDDISENKHIKNKHVQMYDEALYNALCHGYVKISQILIKHGADIHVYGDKALIIASQKGYYITVKFMLDNGIDISESAIAIAIKHNRYDIVDLFYIE